MTSSDLGFVRGALYVFTSRASSLLRAIAYALPAASQRGVLLDLDVEEQMQDTSFNFQSFNLEQSID
jgi:hypothetical protein